MNDGVLLTRDGRVLTVELANPAKANALSAAVVDAVMHALSAPAADGLGLVVFKGQGAHFCSGTSVSRFGKCCSGLGKTPGGNPMEWPVPPFPWRRRLRAPN